MRSAADLWIFKSGVAALTAGRQPSTAGRPSVMDGV
jgi:hypothetical protein